MKIVAIVTAYTNRVRIALRTNPPLTAALAREFGRRRYKDYPGRIEARGGLLLLSVPEIKLFPHDVKGSAIPIILTRELTDAEQRLAAKGSSGLSADDPAELPLEPVDVLEPDRTRYLNTYKDDLELHLENFE